MTKSFCIHKGAKSGKKCIFQPGICSGTESFCKEKAVLVSGMRGRMKKKKIPGKIVLFLLIFIFEILSFSIRWAKANYANIGFAEIVFHLNMPLEGTSGDLLYSYLEDALIPAVLFALFFFSIYIGLRGKKYYLEAVYRRWQLKWNIKWIVYGCVCLNWIFLLYQAEQEFGMIDFAKNQLQQSSLIKEEYVEPKNVAITFPKKKRNLITIYVESAETTLQDKANGGMLDKNYIPEMTALARENVSFSQSELLEGAAVAPACGWTIAGLVAETSGLPLKLFTYDDHGADNDMGNYAHFLPGVTSLGDILEEEGYKNFFMAGSDFAFGGRTSYYTSHGNHEIWDYYTAKEEGKIPEDYKVFWGFEDRKLYEFAKEKLEELAAADQPFNFSLLTVDTHQPSGYVCELCEEEYGEQYGNVWACASRQLDGFIRWIKEQDFYENTTIVILGDHCSMSGDLGLSGISYDKHTGSTARKVYNAFIHSAVEPVKEENRRFTTMDMFPTILGSLGVEIEGNRLALGTNLFSDEQTLAEEYGYEYLFDELNKKSLFYDEELLYP